MTFNDILFICNYANIDKRKVSRMGKKKKQYDVSEVIHTSAPDVDENLDQTYDELVKEIKTLRLKLAIVDNRAKKKLKKKKHKGKYKNHKDMSPYSNEGFRIYMRQQIVKDMESSNLVDRVERFLKQIAPVVVIVARLFASLIVAILSIDAVKLNITPETLQKMDGAYKLAMSIG